MLIESDRWVTGGGRAPLKGGNGVPEEGRSQATAEEVVKGLMRCYWKGLRPTQNELGVHLHHQQSQSHGVGDTGHTSTRQAHTDTHVPIEMLTHKDT